MVTLEIKCHPQGIGDAEVPHKHVPCDVLWVASFHEDAISFLCIDGEHPDPVPDKEQFKIWALMAMRLLDLELPASKKQLCAVVWHTWLKHFAEPLTLPLPDAPHAYHLTFQLTQHPEPITVSEVYDADAFLLAIETRPHHGIHFGCFPAVPDEHWWSAWVSLAQKLKELETLDVIGKAMPKFVCDAIAKESN